MTALERRELELVIGRIMSAYQSVFRRAMLTL
jgi:hypothetical protein